MITRGIGGATSPTTPSTNWCWPWFPARVGECAEEVVEEVKERLGDRPPELFTSDEHAAYGSAIVTAFSEPEPAGPSAGPAPAAAGSGLGLCDGSQRAEEGSGRVHPAINCAGGRADR
jgi:hypothetical protein